MLYYAQRNKMFVIYEAENNAIEKEEFTIVSFRK